jgi:hypothetical protein
LTATHLSALDRRGGPTLRVCAALVLLLCLAGCWKSGDGSGSQSAHTTSSPVPAATRYVSPTGRDTWPGTKAHPWHTLARALPALTDGQVLYVRGGRYRENLVRLNLHEGTADNPILVKAYPGERPVVKGVFWLYRPSYWTIDGINVTWDDAIRPRPLHMVKITGGVGWIWRNSDMGGSRAAANVLVAGYGAKEPSTWSLSGNCIHDLDPATNRSSNLTIGAMKNAGPGIVTRNLLFNAPSPQNVAFGSHAAGGPKDVEFSYNTLYGSQVAVSFAGDTRGVTVERNIFAGVTSGLAVRWTDHKGSGNSVRQNLGGVRVFRLMRPATEDVMGGPGNVVRDDVSFTDTNSCRGFQSKSSATFPYGRDALSK